MLTDEQKNDAADIVRRAQEPGSPIIAKVAAKYGLTPTALISTLKKQVFPATPIATNEMIAQFLSVADEYDLNPINGKELWAFPAKGTVVPVASVDGWSKMVNSHPMMNGVTYKDTFDESGNIISVECSIYRKDRLHPTVISEYLKECKRDTNMWRQWPVRMLRWKSFITTARQAFSFAIFDQDEYERMVEVGGENRTKRANDTSAAALRDRLLARPVIDATDPVVVKDVVPEKDSAAGEKVSGTKEPPALESKTPDKTSVKAGRAVKKADTSPTKANEPEDTTAIF
jgi:hypothetical protein